ncbi:IS66-like element accessory protein TnpA [Paraburkholderia sediminicola]|uniref:IS66-like element accessory protein TnpA n=1 Tax=Paraburkholderia sediminicola TaxID=458836 RepID=UPI0038BA51AF
MVPITSNLMGTTLSQPEEKIPGTRTGHPNYARASRERLSASACEPGVSVTKLARENGINANTLFTWRRRYLAEQQGESGRLIQVVLLTDTQADVVASSPVEPCSQDTKPVAPTGTSEIRIDRSVVKVDGVVDAAMLRIVLGRLRS